MKEKQTLWLVVHTHWEGAVFKTRDEYLEDGFRIILNGLNLLEQHPSYRFVLDQVYDDSLTSFRFSKRLVDEIIDRKFESILAKIDTQGAGIPVVVFNGQGWSRTDVAEIAVAFSEPGIVDVNLQGPDGEEVAVQITAPQRFDDGGLRQAKLVFVAEDIPALGYAVYHVLPQQSLRASGQVAGRAGTEHWSKAWSSGTSHRDSSSVENEFYRATFNCWTGEMTSLYVKDGGWEALSGPANVIAREHDGGDFWELYGNLDGARNIAMSRTHAVPTRETGAQLSNQFVGAGNVVEGPVFAEFNSAQPFGSGSLSTRVRVYNGIRRVEIRTTINNEDRFVRYRAVFPTACEKGTNTHEIPFGAIERAEGIEFPAQRWVDCGDEQQGVAFCGRWDIAAFADAFG